jgi:hypothetical protein
MVWLKRIFLLILVLAVLFVGGAFLLPRDIEVARSTVISAPPEAIFPHVNDLKKTEAWSPWMGRDPAIKIAYSGPEAGIGNKMIWTSDHPEVGSGAQEIVASVKDQTVRTALDFGDMGTASAEFVLAAKDGGTELTWSFYTDAGMNPMMRWMGLMMDGWVGKDYEAGLANLKSLVEGG